MADLMEIAIAAAELRAFRTMADVWNDFHSEAFPLTQSALEMLEKVAARLEKVVKKGEQHEYIK